MFERFTERARRVIVLAQEEARVLQHNYIGTEHLLLGLVADGQGIAAQALEAMDISLEVVREQVGLVVRPGKKPLSGHIPFTPRAKKALELALREALQLGDNYIGTEHILLGMLAEGDGIAAQVLTGLGVQPSVLRIQVISLSPGSSTREVEVSGPGLASAGSLAGRRRVAQAGPFPLPPRLAIEARLQELSARLDTIEAHLGIGRPAEQSSAATEVAGGGPAAGERTVQPADPDPGESGSQESEDA
jgi:ATP-dependent Clp protease ATP-binding subunit ClpC